MNTEAKHLREADLTERVIGIFYAVYNELGSGFLESVYENTLVLALRESGLEANQQVPLNVHFRGTHVGEFKVDILVSRRLIIELKAVSRLMPIHEVQLVNYLKASGVPVGLLLNFGPRPQFKRRIFGSVRSDPRSSALIRVKNYNV